MSGDYKCQLMLIIAIAIHIRKHLQFWMDVRCRAVDDSLWSFSISTRDISCIYPLKSTYWTGKWWAADCVLMYSLVHRKICYSGHSSIFLSNSENIFMVFRLPKWRRKNIIHSYRSCILVPCTGGVTCNINFSGDKGQSFKYNTEECYVLGFELPLW